MGKEHLKKIIIFLVLIIIGLSSLFFYRMRVMPSQTVPTPYYFAKNYQLDTSEAEKSDILIVGDRMGSELNRYMSLVVDQTAKYFQSPLKIYDWTEKNEGLHRTIHKINSLKKLPPVIIYAGGSSEFVEKKFNIEDKEKIIENFKIFRDDRISSLIITFPFLSKVFYKYFPHIKLDKKTKFLDPFANDSEVLSYIEMTYKLFESEYLNFTKKINNLNTNFLVITPPLNLNTPPKKVCAQSTSATIKELNTRIAGLMKKGQYKLSVNLLQKTGQKAPGNATTYFLLGQSLKNLGLFRDAKVILYKAGAYDCSLWRGNIIFNKVLITESERNGIDVIDFNAIVNDNFGKNILFKDDIYPQAIYYQKLTKKISEKVTKYFNVKDDN